SGRPGARLDVPSAQPRLPDREPFGDRRAREPEIHEVPAGCRPDRMPERVAQETRGHGEGTPERLAEPAAEERPDERREEEVRDRALVAMAHVGGRDEVGLRLPHRPDEPLDSLLRYRG